MKEILHRVIIEAQAEKVFNAIVNTEKLSAWWAQAKGGESVGETVSFYFGPQGEHQIDMKIVELLKNEKVVWQCTQGPWENTLTFEFNITKDKRGSALQFSHFGWPEADEFYMHCNTKWGYFLAVSLKSLLETGTGSPHPHDPDI